MPTQSPPNPIRDKIIKALTVYSRVSPSMLHTGIGPSMPSALWRPELDKLIEEGIVKQTETTVDNRRYTVLELVEDSTELPHKLKTV